MIFIISAAAKVTKRKLSWCYALVVNCKSG